MGRYLQDFIYRVQLSAGREKLAQEQVLAVKSAQFIAEIFSFYLPGKYKVGEDVGRIIISLTQDEKASLQVTEIGYVAYCEVYFDYDSLIALNAFDRKEILLDQFCKGLEWVCKKYNCDFSVFETIKQKLIADKMVLNDFYKDRKVSPDKQHFAQMEGFYSEDHEDRALSLIIFDKHKKQKAIIYVGNYDFRTFDRLKWLDNKTVSVYHINDIQSYRSKKVAEDSFLVDIETKKVVYNPVTRESIFDYGVKLLTEMNLYEEAIYYIEQAKKLGHGKADNILKNLEIAPDLRDKAKLLQPPRRKK